MLLGGGIPPIAQLISRVIVVLIAMDVHEFAHAYMANRMGDSTARDMGKMTLNPFVNINWLGFAMFVLIGFGILGSAPVNEFRMRDRRWGMFVAVLAGPVSNLLLAAICAIPFWLGLTQPEFGALPRQFIPTINEILTDAVYFNIILFVFNLLPMFPLDGWTILGKLLPADLRYQWERYKMYTYYAFWGLILLSFIGINVLGDLIGQPIQLLLTAFLTPIFPIGAR
ncbi:MAG: site-2 protease family protein [Aggregatilineales bacterium]